MLNDVQDGGRNLRSPALRAALKLKESPAVCKLFDDVAAGRFALAKAARAAEQARITAIQQQQRDDCALAQNFNNIVRNDVSLQAGQLSTISFPTRPQTFELRNKLWGFGDASIKGPGGLPWFKMVRTNVSFFDWGEIFKSCNFVITTNSGEPLLVLQETFSWMDYKYDLYRLDPKVPGHHIPVAHIRRHWTLFSFNDNYSVTLYGPMASHPPVICKGSWPDMFSLISNGVPVASVEKRLLSFTDKYKVEIAPGQDCLLFLGIACAIDRIHHEVEEARRRRISMGKRR